MAALRPRTIVETLWHMARALTRGRPPELGPGKSAARAVPIAGIACADGSGELHAATSSAAAAASAARASHAGRPRFCW